MSMTEVEQAIYRMTEFAVDAEKLANDTSRLPAERESSQVYYKAFLTALTALHEKLARERGRGCAYCVIGKRSPDAEYCSNCGSKLTPALPELANESEEVNPDSHQYVDNDSTSRRKSVKQKCRNLHSETAEICTLRCDYCGKYAKESDLTTEYTKDKYLMCRDCKEKRT
jgi:hypothetical protein